MQPETVICSVGLCCCGNAVFSLNMAGNWIFSYKNEVSVLVTAKYGYFFFSVDFFAGFHRIIENISEDNA